MHVIVDCVIALVGATGWAIAAVYAKELKKLRSVTIDVKPGGTVVYDAGKRYNVRGTLSVLGASGDEKINAD